MTLRQEAYAMIDALPDDDSIQFFIDMIKQFNSVMKKNKRMSEVQNTVSGKRQAFLHMEEMKKKYPFPADYDYEQVRREAMEEKYGCIN
ncbi:MAG: hypothetical protein NC231_06485 [Bacillus sp. (in: Bacteria)]|nr:hypothetical protein [Bacillus sp. (in: firmicutes)]MCM1425262.1 hypothetical protein [Eubacterium sp.]